MTDNSGKKVVLKKIPCIYYPVQFQESQKQIRALLDSDSEIHTMNPAFTQKLDLHIRKTNIRTQKIDDFVLETFRMVIADF